MHNLDLKCVELGGQLADVKDVSERVLSNALSVLEEQGLYAFFLYLHARERAVGKEISKRCAEFLRKIFPHKSSAQNEDALVIVRSLAEDLDDLLFARDLIRQAVIYGLYHVKAKAEEM
ncbi:hypothetical protein DRP77_07180 [Candidatus Poribacteria bacterium]|nr:MAG: hypothetical protein DRP77_07180 [Candidatus Poribacteria bacterium]